MAEEDLIYGKNRHLFGGIEPSKMLAFSAVSSYDAASDKVRIKLIATLPEETTIEGQTLCSVAGAVIRRKTGGYPTDEFDGTLVTTLTESGTYYDEDGIVVDETYYYAAFPFSGQGVYNRSPSNRAEIKAMKYTYLYGYDLDTSDSNPATRVTYPADVNNASYEPAKMDYTAGTFNYGGWTLEAGEHFMPRPCMLKFDGTVDYYLNPDNYAKQADGATDSAIANTSYGGNAMMEWPKIYTKRWEGDDGIYHFRCSDQPQGDDWDCWCNYDKNDNVIDHFYTPIYFGSLVSSKMRSLSGQANSVNTTAAQEITYATANGDDWYTEVLADRLLIQDLLVMMARSTDGQTAYGAGVTSGSSAIKTGTMNAKGMFWGSTTTTVGVKVFGMENWWGNLWRRTAGWIYSGSVQYVKLTRGKHDGSAVTDYNTTGSGYVSVANSGISGSSGGYISKMKAMAYGRLPIAASGSSSTYEADSAYFATSDVYYAFVGGDYGCGLIAGPFGVNLNGAASDSFSNGGASLSCKPCA